MLEKLRFQPRGLKYWNSSPVAWDTKLLAWDTQIPARWRRGENRPYIAFASWRSSLAHWECSTYHAQEMFAFFRVGRRARMFSTQADTESRLLCHVQKNISLEVSHGIRFHLRWCRCPISNWIPSTKLVPSLAGLAVVIVAPWRCVRIAPAKRNAQERYSVKDAAGVDLRTEQV